MLPFNNTVLGMTDVLWEQKHTHRVLMGNPEGKGPLCRPRLRGRTILERYKSWSFRGFRIQRNFLGQTAVSGCEVFPAFWELTPSPSSGCAGGLVEPLCLVLQNHQQRPENWDGVISRNVGKPSHLDAAFCPRKFQWKLEGILQK